LVFIIATHLSDEVKVLIVNIVLFVHEILVAIITIDFNSLKLFAVNDHDIVCTLFLSLRVSILHLQNDLVFVSNRELLDGDSQHFSKVWCVFDKVFESFFDLSCFFFRNLDAAFILTFVLLNI